VFPANSQIQARQFLQFKWSGFPSKPKQTLLCPLKYVRNVQILRCDSHYQLNTSKILGQNVKYTSSFWTLTETLQVMQMTHTNSNTRTTVNGIRRKTTNVENIMKCCINSTSQNSSNLYPKKTQTKKTLQVLKWCFFHSNKQWWWRNSKWSGSRSYGRHITTCTSTACTCLENKKSQNQK